MVSQFATNKGDAGGDKTGNTVSSLTGSTGTQLTKDQIPVTQVGLQLTSRATHSVVSINLVWLLLTGFLVLFMQVGTFYVRDAASGDAVEERADEIIGVIRASLL